jgi:small subunit ribosomal protein S7
MSRRNTAERRPILSDPTYRSRLVTMLIQRLMQGGKRSVASRILYESLNRIADQTGEDPLRILEQAVRNSTPLVEVKARRVGGSVYQVPREVRPARGTALSLRWIIAAAKARSGRGMVPRLTQELVDASNRAGNAVRKREESHRQAEANRAFAHYRV